MQRRKFFNMALALPIIPTISFGSSKEIEKQKWDVKILENTTEILLFNDIKQGVLLQYTEKHDVAPKMCGQFPSYIGEQIINSNYFKENIYFDNELFNILLEHAYCQCPEISYESIAEKIATTSHNIKKLSKENKKIEESHTVIAPSLFHLLSQHNYAFALDFKNNYASATYTYVYYF